MFFLRHMIFISIKQGLLLKEPPAFLNIFLFFQISKKCLMMRRVAAAQKSELEKDEKSRGGVLLKNPNWKSIQQSNAVSIDYGDNNVKSEFWNEMLLKNPNWKKYIILGLLDVYVNYFFGCK
jgi:hypothetical protein